MDQLVENQIQTQIAPIQAIKPSLFQKIFRSNFVWFIALLLLTEAFLYYCKPLKFVHVQGAMLKDHDHVGSKISAVLANPKSNDVLTFGDSTANSLSCHADVYTCKSRDTSETRFVHLTSLYGQEIFKKEFGIPFTIQNLYFGGCLISDQAMMLSKLLERQSLPKVVFLTLVPRPFIDTTVEKKISPVICYFNTRHSGLEHVKNIKNLIEYVLNSTSNIYKTHSDYATVLSSLACSTFNKPINAYVASGKTGITSKNKVSIFGKEEAFDPQAGATKEECELEYNHYKKAYIFDQATFDYQFSQHLNMLNSLKKKGIETIVVQLPLDKTNLSLLDPKVLTMWKTSVSNAARSTDATMIDLQTDSRFDSSDFIDGIHLKGSGGVKAWQAIIEQMKKDPALITRLKSKM